MLINDTFINTFIIVLGKYWFFKVDNECWSKLTFKMIASKQAVLTEFWAEENHWLVHESVSSHNWAA